MPSNNKWEKNLGKAPEVEGLVEVELRNGSLHKGKQEHFIWDFDNSLGDIIRWRKVSPPKDDSVVTNVVQETLNERGSRYGDFADNAKISQELQRILKNSPSFPHMSEVQIEGMTAVMQKIARILNGDPNYADNWHDIQGYARLVEERLPKEKKDGC